MEKVFNSLGNEWRFPHRKITCILKNLKKLFSWRSQEICFIATSSKFLRGISMRNPVIENFSFNSKNGLHSVKLAKKLARILSLKIEFRTKFFPQSKHQSFAVEFGLVLPCLRQNINKSRPHLIKNLWNTYCYWSVTLAASTIAILQDLSVCVP